MGFKKGNKLGGRKPGSTDRTNKEVRQLFKALLENNLETLQSKFNEIEDPSKYIKLTLELAQFCTPKLRSIEVEKEPTQTPEDFNMKEEEIKKVIDKFMKMY